MPLSFRKPSASNVWAGLPGNRLRGHARAPASTTTRYVIPGGPRSAYVAVSPAQRSARTGQPRTGRLRLTRPRDLEEPECDARHARREHRQQSHPRKSHDRYWSYGSQGARLAGFPGTEPYRSRASARGRRQHPSVAHSRNMTLEDLAASAGLSVTYLGQTERGQRNPSALVLWRIAGALGARLDQLVATDPDQPL